VLRTRRYELVVLGSKLYSLSPDAIKYMRAAT